MDGITAPQQVPTLKATAAFTILDDAVREFGPRPALEFMGRVMRYDELGRLANRAAAGLQGIGVTKGVKVGLCLPNCPYFVIMYFAILKAGGTVVNFNPLYTEREIEAQARDTGVSVMVSMDLAMIQTKIGALAARGVFRHAVVCAMANALPALKGAAMLALKGKELAAIPAGAPYVTFRELISGASTPVPVAIDPHQDIAVLQFTGGTTGTPKAAMLTHANITINLAQILQVFPQVERGAERILGVLPFFHVFAMTCVMNFGLSIGAEILLIPRLDLKLLMSTIYKRRPTIVDGVPTLFTAICNAVETAKSPELSFIKFCASGGAPLSPEVLDRFEHVAHTQVLEGYGLSETSPVACFNRTGAIRRGSVGRELPGTAIEIRDPANPELVLPRGAHGEICIRGPQVMLGYYNKPEETAAVFTHGALRTGDVGYLDEDGYLFIVDRIKDLIICGGYNVYPRVIEEAAYQHPAVQDAMAIGVPDPYRGQAPKLFVTLRTGAVATSEEILAFLTGHLNKIEIPRSVEIRETLPKTMVGKLSKKDLIAEEKAKEAVAFL
jgi:long-chain acyl-CoA synthetase